MFELHPQLAQDTLYLGNLPLSAVLLMNDDHYPWVILVPRRAGIDEIYRLSEQDQLQLAQETNGVSACMASLFAADKMNTAALGNMVAQLHVHVIVRFRGDAAWPKPVWGLHQAQPYGTQALSLQREKICAALGSRDIGFEPVVNPAMK